MNNIIRFKVPKKKVIFIFFFILLLFINNNVNANSKKTIETKVNLSKSSAIIDLNKTIKLNAKVSPSSESNNNITWTSSNPKIATVSEGTVKGKSPGIAIITAKSKNGKKATCKVTVKGIVASKVKIYTIELKRLIFKYNAKVYKESVNMFVNQKLKLNAEIMPSNATNKGIIWTSSNPKIATVSQGIVKAIAPGSVTIRANTSNGKYSECKVKVKYKEPEDVRISENKKNIYANELVRLNAKVSPSDADPKIIWTSSNNNIAKVNKNTGDVKGISKGNATITAITSNGIKSTCSITVTEEKPKKILLDKKNVLLEINNDDKKTIKINATIDSFDTNKSRIKWKSSNSQIATVDENGNITAHKIGKVIVTAYCGNIEANCNVTVWYTKGLFKKNNKDSGFKYWIYIPDSSVIKDFSNIPMVIYLHGNNNIGNDLNKLKSGESLVKLLYDDKNFNKYKGIIIAPQASTSFSNFAYTDRIKVLVNSVASQYGVCRNKISMTGFSGGAVGTWIYANKNPNSLYKVVLVAGYKSQFDGTKINYGNRTRFKLVVGNKDIDSLRSMKIINKNLRNSELIIIPDKGHGCIYAYNNKDYNLINWMME